MQLSYKPEPHKATEVFHLPNNKTDVFLRRNETTETDEEGNIIYVAEEIYFQADENLSEEYVEKNFEILWRRAENPSANPTPEEEYKERIEVLEGALTELTLSMYQ